MTRKEKDRKFEALYEKFLNKDNLVVGCGVGDEISNLADSFPSSFFVGVDLDITEKEAGKNWYTINMDAQSLTFPDNSFDFVYCYHVLEHVQNPNTALAEISRVLRFNSSAFVGTPNKNRIFGYFTSEASLGEKLRWNLDDWKKRFAGKFENNLGAHAGFTKKELEQLLFLHFSNFESLTLRYYINLYPRSEKILKILDRFKLLRFIVPSVYYVVKTKG